jgi:hypothetical protein
MIARVKGLVVGALVSVLMTAVGCGSSGGSSKQDAAADATADGGAAGAAGSAAGGTSGASGAAGSTTDGAAGSDVSVDGHEAGAADVSTDSAPPLTAMPTSAMDLCTSFCQRVSTCDTTRDDQTCVASCTNANAAVFPKLRTDLVDAAAACVAQDDCATITRDGALASCLVEAAAGVGPSAKATAFCTALDTAETTCGVTLDKATCLGEAKIYGDDTLTSAAACTTKTCSLIYSCASATLTLSAGTGALGGGLSPGKRCGGTPEPCGEFEFSQTQCQASGCHFSAICEGGSPSCSFESSQGLCSEIPGCTWSGSACTGTATPCASFTTQSTCQTSFECFWEGNCTGTPPACSTLSTTACPSQGGCMVQDAL